MDLKQQLSDFGCGREFIEIALTYAQFYNPETDIETFIEYVEEAHAKVEEAEAQKMMEQEIVDASGVFEAFKDDEDI
ncbi:MAG: hypothetical protein AB7U44_10640 [Sulfuricurvum sp.]|uniref:hypothetical protein n=1 Tax=Sulfuricurvum sp. TaxID=2025608 RepID=UPI002632F9EE|nr:hypothetical protein [Sulfuricurvum sp.]MDD2838872.1 hypothetical protein [Sulfuricurvum sp.]MDD3598119.1 hypothetical protein [Sulfuricurvum sp.]